MESLSSNAFWLALVAAVLATALSWTRLLGVRLVMRRLPALSYAEGATEAADGPLVATVGRSQNGNGWSQPLGRLTTLATWTLVALLVVSVLARWRAVDHAPWSNMYEFTIAFATAITGFYVLFERWSAAQAEGRPAAQAVGALVLPVVLAMLAATAAFFPSDIRPLVPALQNSDLLAIHVATMILAYGALSTSFGAAALYLAQTWPERGRGRESGGRPSGRFPGLPRSELLDEVAYKSVMIGFPLLAAGIALGAYWANSAWGRYWGWDPKETSALVTWLIYGIYLHTRGLRHWSGRRSAAVLVVGFASVMFTYFAVNLWVSGLHSYAGV